ncbi:MAG: acetylornithine deacetylase [Gammaproteobacteria bacterium]|nr:acetylornithine deacetylase [Gammaproteobacteria bacterium]
MGQIVKELATTLEHLTALVGFDTQNPPRDITTESGIFSYLKKNLPGFTFKMYDAGKGCISLLATRGNPELLFNFHIDTVPTAPAWSTDPFSLIIDESEEKATGLGACDIKGASACMLTAISKVEGDVALLFSSDEEHGSSVAVKYFLATNHGYKKVIISEPTQVKAVLAHRGIQSAKIQFCGTSGHASEPRALKDSAIHKSGKWISATLDWVEKQTQSFESLSGLPFNIGKINGGIKANMIASNCELAFGFRPLPGQDAKAMLVELQQLASTINNISSDEALLTNGFFGPTLPAANQSFELAIENATALATENQLPIGPAVAFWTEASLFSEAGLTAIVFGPGDIAQAHTADEWVSLNQLQQVELHYTKIIGHSHSKNNSGKSHE